MTEVSAPKNAAQPYPSDALEIGTKLNGYRIHSMLGRGSFGITYLAVEERLDRQVAIKEYLPLDIATRDKDRTVHPRTGSHEELFQYGLESFLKEAKTLVKFKHENIVSVLTYFEHFDTAYLVMEYEVGQDLNSYFSEHPSLSEKELLAIFSPIIEGLAVVHQHGFIHRDIKPDNIYIRGNRSPVLLDFGAARDVVRTKADNLTRILTEGYAPYEQDNPAWADQGPWTDIYALGATLYIAVMGVKPISAAGRAAACMMQKEDPYVSALTTDNTHYSQSFLTAIDKALEFHPADRPQSLTAWNQMLVQGLSDATVVKPSPSAEGSDATVVRPTAITDKNQTTQKTPYQHAERETKARSNHLDSGKRRLLVVVGIFVALLTAGVGGYYWLKLDDTAPSPTPAIPEDLAGSALMYGKTACWHYARLKRINVLIEKIKGLPSTSDRTRFIADQMNNLSEAEKGFEKNFSQYSISIIKLRRYPVESIEQAIQYFLQSPDYINDRAYKVIAEVTTAHATGGKMSTEEWKNDLIDVSVDSGAFN